MIRRWQAFVRQRSGLGPYLDAPGDGRVAPVVPARALLWAILAAYVLRDGAFHAVEAFVRRIFPSRVSECLALCV